MKTIANNPLTYAIAAGVATVLQVIALVRYVDREPDDAVGVTLYAVTVVLFAVVATGAFIAWRSRSAG